jgi:hypothetical protein
MAIFVNAIAAAQSSTPAMPTISFVYSAPFSTPFDRGCGAWLKTAVKPESVQEAIR